jgi:hypothetical protein
LFYYSTTLTVYTLIVELYEHLFMVNHDDTRRAEYFKGTAGERSLEFTVFRRQEKGGIRVDAEPARCSYPAMA